MKKKAERTIILFILVVFMFSLTGPAFADEPVLLSFKSASGYEYLKTLNGKTVCINGFLATSSPVDGSFIFLMNLPYQSCPFCKPNTSQLSNTMEVYPKSGESFPYTTQAVRVTGTLEVTKDESAPFTDLYGYEFNFRITDASYTILRDDELSPEMAVWQRIAQTDVISDIYSMYDYLNFLCSWPSYSCDSYTDDEGNYYPGYYLYASDAEWFIKTDGAQFNYGYQPGYFESIVSDIRSADSSAFDGLIANVEAAEALAQKALAELEDGCYTFELQYVERFDNTDYVYTLTKGTELQNGFDELYYTFADWLGNWEM